MVNCKLLNIEIDVRRICPASKNFRKRFLCYKDCGFSPLRYKNRKITVQAKLDNIYTVQSKLYVDTGKGDVAWNFGRITSSTETS
jgi:hypothetical protein